MTVMEAIRGRKSIRAYTGEPVEEEKLIQVLEAGQLAPSARNQQAWKFYAVKNPSLREKIKEACYGQNFVGEAPVVLVACANDVRDMRCGQPARTVDCSIAMSFMILEATELGLGTCWIGSFSPDEIRKILNIPADYDIVAVSPLGYPAVEGNPRSRKPLPEIAEYK